MSRSTSSDTLAAVPYNAVVHQNDRQIPLFCLSANIFRVPAVIGASEAETPDSNARNAIGVTSGWLMPHESPENRGSNVANPPSALWKRRIRV
jgi:hypothetical protein